MGLPLLLIPAVGSVFGLTFTLGSYLQKRDKANLTNGKAQKTQVDWLLHYGLTYEEVPQRMKDGLREKDRLAYEAKQN